MSDTSSQPSRRAFLGGSAAGLTLGGLGGFLAGHEPDEAEAYLGTETIEATGLHQPGVISPETNFATVVGYQLHNYDVESLTRLMKLWSSNIVRLMAGQPTITDTEPELATNPAKLTITLGVGPGFFSGELADRKPDWLEQLPAYSIDKLEDQWSGGDLCLLIASEDPTTLSHAVRVMSKEARDFATVKWTQQGFRHTSATWRHGTTIRNLFGQVDGSINPDPVEESELVFRDNGEDWMIGGSTLVIRRIAMNLDTWDELDRPAREVVIGRDLDTGAPLTGGQEKDPVDLEAKNELGFPVIDMAAHARRAQTADPTQRIYRRPYNYDLPPTPETLASGQLSNAGLIFMAFQADIDHQYKPMQAQLAEMDMLNQWTVPIGSSVFAIPPGIGARGQEFLLQELLV